MWKMQLLDENHLLIRYGLDIPAFTVIESKILELVLLGSIWSHYP